MSTPDHLAHRPVDAIADGFVDELAALDPVAATELGIAGHEHELTDLSPDGFAAREALVRRTLAAARAAEPVDDRERAAQAALMERLGLEVERAEAGITRAELSVISSGLHDLRMCFDLMDTSTEEGWRAVDARLASVGEALSGYRRTLEECAQRGQVSARRQYAEVAGQVRGWTGQTDTSSTFATLVATAPAGPLKADLERHAREATAAVADFGRFLGEELAPRGRERDAVGREHYELSSRYFLGAAVDLDETYAWAWEELRRIEDEMARIADGFVPGGTLDDAVAHLEADPTRTIEGKEPFRDWMQQLADRAVDELAGHHFDIPEPIRRIECRIAPTQDGGIYYTGPSEDLSRPGRMWWSVPPGVTRFSPWKEVTTVYHEGVPGHHLQVGQTILRRDLLNRWQRQVCWVSGSGEGWALYAERLMDELGYLSDPADRLGLLDAQGLRAARVIVDIGLHCGLEVPADNAFGFHPGETWTAELVHEFMRAHSRLDEGSLRFEVNRYLGWPGQAPSYKVGERLWLRARDEARARHGASFDLKAFHRAALDLGSIGLEPLTEALARL
ncbi:MAG TPA: DUF885 domain-containing protein [Marmoricola sp.]|nr:DUF885 domain-containing protein [Marmoricola sp.]